MDYLQVRLHSVILSPGANAIGQVLAVLDLAAFGTEVATVRRGKERMDVTPGLLLEEGDVVVLRGAAEGVTLAEEYLLR